MYIYIFDTNLKILCSYFKRTDIFPLSLLGSTMAATSQADNVLGLSKKDLSLIRHSLEAGGKLIHQVINGLKHGTSEVQHLILQQSDVILECRVCRNLFRSLPNYLDHKRIYCQELFPNASVSLLASPFADEVPIVYPEPPDDAKEFVEMSDLISKFNKKNHSEPKDKARVQNTRESIGGTLEQSCQRRKPQQPLCLRPMKETSAALQLVPITTNNTSENKDQMSHASGEEIDLNERYKKPSTIENGNLGHKIHKMANFRKLLCLKCNKAYHSKEKLVFHIKKFHLKNYRKHEIKTSNKDVSTSKAGSSKVSKQNKKLENKNEFDNFSTKSGRPSLKKFSFLAKKSNEEKFSNMNNGWCHICNHSYSGRRGLIFHMFRMHSGSRKIYPCPFCHVKFPSFASALRHTQTLHNCKKSDMKQVVKKLKASAHVENQKLQTMLEPELKVKKCDSQINLLVQGNNDTSSLSVSATNSKTSQQNSKTSKQNSKFKCQKCLQIFCGVRGLRHHMTRKHTATQKSSEHPYTCRICFMAFYTSFSLNKHYRLKHNIQENVQENKSNSEIKVAESDKVKSNSEIKAEAISDEVKTNHIPCQGTSSSVSSKNIHKYRIPLKYYKTVSNLAHFPSLCLNCKQHFAGTRMLIKHIIREHCTNAFPCPFCQLSFISSVSILRHIKVQHSCNDQEIADLNKKLQVWEQQKKRNADLKTRKPVNNISESTSEVQNSFEPTCSIHDVTDFKTARCLLCKRDFIGVQGLMTHISKIHTSLSDQKHDCFQCTESFTSVFAIMKHMENIHDVFFKQKTNRLLEIGESTEPSSLSEERIEEKEKILNSCKLEKTCGENASNSQLVMECADFPKSRCLRCKEIFAGHRGLIAHIYKDHADHSQTYSCYLCMKTFASFALASRHTRNSHIYKGSAMMYVRVNDIRAETSVEK